MKRVLETEEDIIGCSSSRLRSYYYYIFVLGYTALYCY